MVGSRVRIQADDENEFVEKMEVGGRFCYIYSGDKDATSNLPVRHHNGR